MVIFGGQFLIKLISDKTISKSKFIVLGCWILIVIVFFAILINARHLRPAADDYCTGFIAQYGVFGAPAHMWSTWSGYFFTMFIENITNGLPLLHLPWSISSAIPFILSAVGLGFTAYILLPKSSENLNPVFLIPLLAVLWWAFIWIPVAFFGVRNELANGLTHWQTLTSGYMLTTEILLCICAYLWRLSNHIDYAFLVSIIFLISGLLFGFTSEPFNLAAIAVFGLYILHRIFFKRASAITKKQIYWIVFGLSIIVGFIFAHLSPGNLARTALIKPDLSFSLDRMEFLFFWTIPYAVQRWLSAYFAFQGIIVFIIVFSLQFFSVRKLSDLEQHQYLLRGMQLSSFGLLLFMIARFGEAFSYEGYWHFVTPLLVSMLSIYFFATYVANKVRFLTSKWINRVILVSLLISLSVALKADFLMMQSIQMRAIAWSQGQAPLSGISDIETLWVRGCWENLIRLRGPQDFIKR